MKSHGIIWVYCMYAGAQQYSIPECQPHHTEGDITWLRETSEHQHHAPSMLHINQASDSVRYALLLFDSGLFMAEVYRAEEWWDQQVVSQSGFRVRVVATGSGYEATPALYRVWCDIALLRYIHMLICTVSTFVATACSPLQMHVLSHDLVTGAGVNIKILLDFACMIMSSNDIWRKRGFDWWDL